MVGSQAYFACSCCALACWMRCDATAPSIARALTSFKADGRLIGSTLPRATGGVHGTGGAGVAISRGRLASRSCCAQVQDACVNRKVNAELKPRARIIDESQRMPTFPTLRNTLNIGPGKEVNAAKTSAISGSSD